jgi:hypothetical protein
MNTIAYFEIHSSDPQREIAFYAAIFGWTFHKETGMPMSYYRIATEGMHGGLMQRPFPIKENAGTNAFCCSIEVANFDETAAAIVAHGGQIALPKFAVPQRCWQGYFTDTDQNVFGIFQVDLNAQ